MPSLIFIKKLPIISYHVKSINPEIFAPELSWSFFIAPPPKNSIQDTKLSEFLRRRKCYDQKFFAGTTCHQIYFISGILEE